MKWVRGGVTAAKGFVASGVSVGIKRNRKPDLALVVSEHPATAAGVLTRNRVQAAPVVISRRRLREGTAQAVLINSGCANCLTGPAGVSDARRIGGALARALGIAHSHLLVASTGLIGQRLPVPRIVHGLPLLLRQLSRAHHEAAAQAILTTDLYPKEAAVEAMIDGRRCRLGGMAKGSGMLSPSMATLLSVLTTDAAVERPLLAALLHEAVDASFNRITVDGDMSTNDSVFLLAGGASGVRIRRGAASHRRFAGMLKAVTHRLAVQLVKDGEGAARVMTVEVRGARTTREAEGCARRVANSPLVKTMLAGGDPNIGRVAAAVGASGARFNPRELEIFVEGRRVVSRGAIVPLQGVATRTLLRRPQVAIVVRLHAGKASSTIRGCDLTEEYVRINAGYST